MPNDLLNHAKAALHESKRALEVIQEVGSEPTALAASGAAISAWSRLLMFGNRVFTKLEQASKASPGGQPWYGSIKSARRSDPLLRYMQHARNADEHALIKLVHNHGGSYHVTVPRHLAAAGKPIMTLDATGGGNHQPAHPDIKIKRTSPPKMILQAVMDRGVNYAVPDAHNGQSIADPTLSAIGELFVKYLTMVVDEAEDRIK